MYGLSEKTIDLLHAYFENKLEIKEVQTFGSRAQGTEKPGSDIDFAIFTNTDQDLAGQVQVELDELQTPYFFDVVDYTQIHHIPLKEHIDRFGKNFFYRKKNTL